MAACTGGAPCDEQVVARSVPHGDERLAEEFGQKLSIRPTSHRAVLGLAMTAHPHDTQQVEVSPAVSRVTTPEAPHDPQQQLLLQHRRRQQLQQQPLPPRWVSVAYERDCTPGMGVIARGIEKSPRRLRRDKLGKFPSVSDLVAFAGAVRADSSTRLHETSQACAGVAALGMRRSQSCQVMSDRDRKHIKGEECPWQRFNAWRASHPDASRAEAKAFVERDLWECTSRPL